MKPNVPDQDILDAIGFEEARNILAAASLEPNSAQDFEAESDFALPTIYRHTNRLSKADLLQTKTQIDPADNHYEMFETTVCRVSLVIERGDWSLNIQVRDDLSDRFTRLWRAMGE